MADYIDSSKLTDDDIDSILDSIDDYDFQDDDFTTGSENIDNEDDDLNDDLDDESEGDLDDEESEGSEESKESDDDLGEEEYGDDNNEDTDHYDEEGEGSSSDDDDDGQDDGEDAGDDSEGGENTQVEQDTKDDEAEGSETNDDNDGKNQDTDTIDAKEFDRYKKFYEEVTKSEFIANGKKIKGFDDPDKIIRSQQMAHGFSEKMAGFKKYKPYMNPLKERGMLEDPDKFNLAMSLIDGDKEAIKQHLKTLEIDPVVDLDIEDIKYTGKNHLASKASIDLDDAFESARILGVEDRVRKVIGSEWDEESFNEFATDAKTRRDLIEHMSTGDYDRIQDKISEIKRLDVDGSYTNMKSTDQYRHAVIAIRQENANKTSIEANAKEEADRLAKVEEEKNKILEERKQAEYKAQVEKKNQEVNRQRKKASSISKKKPKAKPAKKFDPLELDGDELDNFVDGLIG